MNPEIWAEVPGFPLYEVSDLGRVRSWAVSYRGGVKRGINPRYPKPHADHKGYLYVFLGRRNRRFIHHLVLETFVSPRPVGLHACHNNDVRQDNTLSNLRWDTPSANREDSRVNGGMAVGIRQPNAKLTDASVSEMRALHKLGASYADLSRRFGIHWTTAKQACREETWKHVRD